MAEQDRLHEIVRQRAAVDGDERLGAPVARAVDGAGDHFLADPGFAFDQRRNVGGGSFLRAAQHAFHHRRAGDDVGERQRAFAAALEPLQLVAQRLGGERVAQADLNALGAGRLDHEVRRARAHRRDDIVDAAMRGLHDYRNVASGLFHAGHHAEPVEVRHHQVEDHAVDPLAFGSAEEFRRRIAAIRSERLVAETLHHVFDEAALNRIVVDDQHDCGHWKLQPTVPNWSNVAEQP